ncbi:hypothetical protein AAHA92_20512 [Salvia divinorum]|uniref:Uncharacterized protein n=1 Tax=Salvia divinorum TaxID=28513 RepID=A0ABD1GHF9_SALDI
MASEITEDRGQDPPPIEQKEAEKIRIRQIIDYQKSIYFSSSSSASSSSSYSTSSSKGSRRLLDLMREGSAPLKRLFDMEHTSLEKYFKDYSGSPLIRPILLWGDDDDDEAHDDPWTGFGSRFGDDEWNHSWHGSFSNGDVHHGKKMKKLGRRKLYRAKSYKRLPRIGLWRCGRFRFKLRLMVKLRVLIRRKVFDNTNVIYEL